MKLFILISYSFYCLLIFSCSDIESPAELFPPYTDYVKDGGTDYLEFLAYGDAGKGTINQKGAADEMSSYVSDINNDIKFIINLGDSFYENGVSSTTDPLWDSRFESIYNPAVLNMPFYSIPGNHDYRGSVNALLQYVSPINDRWQMPGRYYSVLETLPDSTEILFLFIDTEGLFYGDVDQLVWLDSQLDNATATWKIVLGHRPLFSYGSHGFILSMISRLQPILDNRADLYMAGHEHDLQILSPVNGVSYIINGSAGASRSTGVGKLTIFAANRTGFMAFLISSNQIVCRVLEADKGVMYSLILKEKN